MTRRDCEKYFFIIVFSAIFSFLPWENIWNSAHGYNFIDRDVYRDIFLNQPPYGEPCSFSSIVGCITNERLWDYTVRFFLGQGVQLEHVFQSISFLLIAAFCFFIAIKNDKIWPIFLLFNPLVIDLAFSQLRLSLALSLLYFAYLFKAKSLRTPLVFCSIFIHTASALFIAIYVFSYLSGKKLVLARSKWFVIFILVLTGGVFSILLGPLRELILSYIGDRRAQYQDLSSSVLYSLFWVGLLGCSLFQRSRFLDRLENRFSIIILSLVAFNILFSGYSTRFIAASFPAIISYMLNLSREYRMIVLPMFIYYAYAQWIYWLFVSGN